MKLFKRVKEYTRNVKERWRDGSEDRSTIWFIIGLLVAVPSLLFGWYVALPALGLKIAAWVGHQVWDQIPTINYGRAILVVIGLWVAGWIVGWIVGIVLRTLIRGILWAVR